MSRRLTLTCSTLRIYFRALGRVAESRPDQQTRSMPLGLKLVKTEGDESLPALLRENHFEVQQGDNMTRNEFKKMLKDLNR